MADGREMFCTISKIGIAPGVLREWFVICCKESIVGAIEVLLY